MSYDRMGRRVQYLETCNSITNSHKVFSYDGYLQIANIELTTQTPQLFIWDPTEPIATRPLVFYNSNAQPQYYTHDGNKNVSDLTDSTQLLTAHYEYTPFGALLSSSGTSAITNPFRFSSEYADNTLGLVYYNYRHYMSILGRWSIYDYIEELISANLFLMNDNNCINKYDYLGCAPQYIWKDTSIICENGHCHIEQSPDWDWGDFDTILGYPHRPFIKHVENIEWYKKLPSCPCRLILDENGIPLADQKLGQGWSEPNKKHLHGNAAYQLTWTEGFLKHGQQCMYDSCGKLINKGPSAGTPDYIAHGVFASWIENAITFVLHSSFDGWFFFIGTDFDHYMRPPNKGRDMRNGLPCPENDGTLAH